MKTLSVSLILGSLACGHLALAAGVSTVTGANAVLTRQITNADNDVKKISAANVALNGPPVATTKVEAEEDQVLNSYSDLTEALIQLTNDLVNKKTDLQLTQGSAIDSKLRDLEPAFQAFSAQISRIVGTETAKDSVSESSAEAYAAISDAADEYSNLSAPEVPK
ncbi:MAG: hypothetical protein Q9195_000818 [Heterodermia aff. obscurata]